MKPCSAARAAVLALVACTAGCQEARRIAPTAPSLFLAQVGGVWSGPLTLMGATGGECVAEVVNTFLPATDQATVVISQNGTELSATMTSEKTGLACAYSGTAGVNSLALKASACDATGLFVRCLNGQVRELLLAGSSITASLDGGVVTGTVASTYNVKLDVPPKPGVGSLVANHSFRATRR